jgi:glycine oxidase
MVVFPGGEYAVPRRGGVLLFGSTLERAGFDSRPTREACEALALRAGEVLGLRPGDLLAMWAGLRPGTASGLPFLGPDPDQERLIHASGHYRNGILLAPLTARTVVSLVLGRPPGLDLDPFLLA